MLTNIFNYSQIIFDCDGVILDSNSIKADAFYQVALPYGEKYALELFNYHKIHGGISRFFKFDYFLKTIIGNREATKAETEKLIDLYSTWVYEKLLTCPLTTGAFELLNTLSLKKMPCFISSGGAEAELRQVFKVRNLDHYFQAIFGSPDTKVTHLKKIDLQTKKTLFVGDSLYDYEVASEFDLDFLFLTQYADNPEWDKGITFSPKTNFFKAKNFSELL